MAKDTETKSAIFNSGAISPDAMLAQKLSGGGETFQVPFWNDLADTEADVATDNPSDVATPLNVAASKQRAIRQFRTRGWSDADLVKELAGADPMQRIAERVSAYWMRQFQSTMVKTIQGVIADNVAKLIGALSGDTRMKTA